MCHHDWELLKDLETELLFICLVCGEEEVEEKIEIDISDECERDDCDGHYEFDFNGGGTCDKCGNKIPCF